MRTKNFLISSGVLVGGIIIYKLLFGFVLPIVLFVSLGSILKILLKGSEDNIDKTSSELLKKNTISLSDNNVVEVEPMVQNKSSDPYSDQKLPENKTDVYVDEGNNQPNKTKDSFVNENDQEDNPTDLSDLNMDKNVTGNP